MPLESLDPQAQHIEEELLGHTCCSTPVGCQFASCSFSGQATSVVGSLNSLPNFQSAAHDVRMFRPAPAQHTAQDHLGHGLGFSPDGSRLYHCGSRANIIRVYDVHHDGSVSLWRVFARFEGGTPMVWPSQKMALCGSLWRMAVASQSPRPMAWSAHACQSHSPHGEQ